jgi:hypothetical protein
MALWARPAFLQQDVGIDDSIEGRKCDACGRSGHPAKYVVQFGGKAYHKDTLEEVDNEDEEDDDEDDHVSINSKGQEIPSEDFEWYVGSHCRSNAETAHSLIHWKHALNGWVTDQLRSEGHLEPTKLAQREDWSKKKRSEYANGIVDEWEDGNQIKDLYRDFKANLEAARERKMGRWDTR